MAVITHFEVGKAKGKLHPTQVRARIKVIEVSDAPPIFKIDTGGSDDRENPGKLSQTLQLTREKALELRDVIERVYGL